MMISFPLPSEPLDRIKLADWMELLALQSDDYNSSNGDLERALARASVSPSTEHQNSLILSVFSELEARSFASNISYPFTIESGVVELRGNISEYAAYLFCLCLSYFGWSTTRNWEIGVNPWLLFEELSAIAASEFIGGKSFIFGTSRIASNERQFKAKINRLCKELGEGRQFRSQPPRWKKDDNVDIVVWREFPDTKTSKLVMFGQCAGGQDYKSKLSDLNPDAFWRKWMTDSNISPHIKSFYVPHRIPELDWDNSGRDGGILFDRCRVSHWAFQRNGEIKSDGRYLNWLTHILKNQTPKARTKK